MSFIDNLANFLNNIDIILIFFLRAEKQYSLTKFNMEKPNNLFNFGVGK